MKALVLGGLLVVSLLSTAFLFSPSASAQTPTCPTLPSTTGTDTLSASIATSGTYRIWSRILAPDTTNNSYYLQIDNTCGIKVGDSSTIPANTWTWVDYQNGVTTQTVDVSLSAGNHVITLIGNEPNVGVDRIIITSDLTCVPTGTGDNCNQVPTSTLTPVPVTATPLPTASPTAIPTTITPTLTPTPTKAPTPTPTTAPTATPQPTNTPAPTNTPVPNSAKVGLTVFLHGIGKSGDNTNPTATGNLTPLTTQRTAQVFIYDATNTLVSSPQGTITYNATNGNFTGIVDLGTTLPSGTYLIKIKSPSYLRAAVPGIVTITQGQTTTIPAITLITGDVNNDNQLDILDYNLILDCYSDLSAPRNCDPTKKAATDLTDDGSVNQFDYNLFLRELSIQTGQ